MTDQKSLKSTGPILWGLFITLLLGTFLFYKQRFLFADGAHLLYRIINEGSLQIPNLRYGSFVSQLLPLEGAQFLLPLRTIMLLYSISFNLFYTAILLLLILKPGRYDLAILFAFCLTLFVSYTFYWPTNEIYIGVAWLLASIAIPEYFISKNRPFIYPALSFVVLFSLAIWSHPLLIIIAAYSYLFLALSGHLSFLTKNRILVIALLTIALLVRVYFIFHIGYDTGLMASVYKLHWYEIPHLFTSPHSGYFVKICCTQYWAFTIVLGCGIYGMFKSKKYLLLGISVIFFLTYFLLICATYYGVKDSFYLENEYVPFAVFASMPFVYFFLPLLSKKNIISLLSVLFFSRVVYMFLAAPLFIERTTILESFQDKMKKNNCYKAVMLDDKGIFTDKLKLSWGIPEESMILSALKNEHPQRSFVVMTTEELRKAPLPGKDTLLGCFEKRPASRFNSHYFQMDTSQVYHVLEP